MTRRLLGGKNASLGELVRELTSEGIRVPDGFALTTETYRSFFAYNKLDAHIAKLLSGLNTQDVPALQDAGHKIRTLILKSELPPPVEKEIREAFAKGTKRPCA